MNTMENMYPMAMDDINNGTAIVNDNPNSNANLSSLGMVETLAINIGAFILFLMIFESNRFYKQIYLKRLQNRFQASNRVPPYPGEQFFGWFFEIKKISEMEVLRMVGLDAYMYLRYIVICYKLSLFLSFWGLVVLVPTYATAHISSKWDRFAISNLLEAEDQSMKIRLWVSAIFGYIFAAYFCQLLYAEYYNFSIRRLKYLIQSDPDGQNSDPDTPPQKYYTVMIERIPGHLRSAEQLYKFFDKLFPDDVYTVEVALDLSELDAKCKERKVIREKLEKAIALYESKNERLKVKAHTGNYAMLTDTNDGIFAKDDGTPGDSWTTFVGKHLAPELYGIETVDAINHYTTTLQELNQQVKELQEKNYKMISKTDERMLHKMKSRHDTRAAHFFEQLQMNGKKTLDQLAHSASNIGNPNADPHPIHKQDSNASFVSVDSNATPPVQPKRKSFFSALKGVRVDQLLFGADETKPDLGAALNEEMLNLSGENLHHHHEHYEHHHEHKERETPPENIRKPPLPTKTPKRSSMMMPPKEGAEAEEEHHPDVLVEDIKAVLIQEPALKEWLQNADVDFDKEAAEEARRADEFQEKQKAERMEMLRKGTEMEMRSYLEGAAFVNSTLINTQRGPVNPFAPTTARSVMGDISSRNSSSEDLGALEGGTHPYDHTILHESTPAVRRSSRNPTNDFIDHLGDMRRLSTSQDPAEMPTSSSTSNNNSVKRSSKSGYAPLPDQQASNTDSTIKGAVMSGVSKLFNLGNSNMGSQSSHSGTSNHNVHFNEDEADFIHDQRNRNESSASAQTANNTKANQYANVFNPLNLGKTEVLTEEQRDAMNALMKENLKKAHEISKEGWEQTKIAGSGAIKGAIEIERMFETLLMGAYYKYSSTAFVTFKSRVTESIAHQMLLSHDAMEINHAPNPHDIIWDNVSIPKSQIKMRSFFANVAVVVGSVFWSSLVNSVNGFAEMFPLPQSQQQMVTAVVMLVFLVILPFIFDYIARNYEGLKLESEVQNSIMTRYFYYQLINVYVTVGFSGSYLWLQLYHALKSPQTLVDIIGGKVADVSLFFTNLIIVKVFSAIPLEMLRPAQLSTILMMGTFMDRRQTTRRDLRTGVFYSWSMLYGWCYPQLMMVLMIMVTYSCITPLMMPFCSVFFAFAYVMYKYQLLYVYINDYQSGGFMWYAVFNRSLVALFFASIALLGYLSLQLGTTSTGLMYGPFIFMLPLPFSIAYFGVYCDAKFKKASMNLSYGFARDLDFRNNERKAAGKPTPQNSFIKTLYRQPSLTEKDVYPEPYRNDGTYDILRSAETGESVLMSDWKDFRNRRGSLSINVHELTDEGEEDQRVLEEYFREVVLPLSVVPPEGGMDESRGASSHYLSNMNSMNNSRHSMGGSRHGLGFVRGQGLDKLGTISEHGTEEYPSSSEPTQYIRGRERR